MTLVRIIATLVCLNSVLSGHDTYEHHVEEPRRDVRQVTHLGHVGPRKKINGFLIELPHCVSRSLPELPHVLVLVNALVL